jgi:hypothetical protein
MRTFVRWMSSRAQACAFDQIPRDLLLSGINASSFARGSACRQERHNAA